MELDDAIRALGYTNVPVKLHHEVVASIKSTCNRRSLRRGEVNERSIIGPCPTT